MQQPQQIGQPQPSLIGRDDTILGVCAGLAEDFGINPLWLRIPLATALFWNPLAVLGGYLAAGVLVLALRLVVPDPRPAARPEAVAPQAPAAAAPAAATAEPEAEEMYWEPVPIAA